MPVGQLLEVRTTSAKREAAAAMRSSSVAIMTREKALLSWHRRQTCSIIVLPAISASGLPGNLVEPYRAGMIATGAPTPVLAGFNPTAREIPPRRLQVHRRPAWQWSAQRPRHHAVAAASLRLAQSQSRVRNHLHRGGIILVPQGCDAERKGKANRLLVPVWIRQRESSRFHRLEDALSEDLGLTAVRLSQDDGKLLAAVAREDIGCSRGGGDETGHCREQAIPCLVSPRLVHLPEVVHVHQAQRERSLEAAVVDELQPELLEQHALVVDLGERVFDRRFVESFLEFFPQDLLVAQLENGAGAHLKLVSLTEDHFGNSLALVESTVARAEVAKAHGALRHAGEQAVLSTDTGVRQRNVGVARPADDGVPLLQLEKPRRGVSANDDEVRHLQVRILGVLERLARPWVGLVRIASVAHRGSPGFVVCMHFLMAASGFPPTEGRRPPPRGEIRRR